MPDVTIDSGGSVSLGNVISVQFIAAVNPPVNQHALLDGRAVSPIMSLNTIRSTVGSGTGATGWVAVRRPGAGLGAPEEYVQLSKVQNVSYVDAETGEFAILKIGSAVLGEVHQAAALAKVKSTFPP